MENKTKSRTICKDQWKRKEYIEICKGDIAKDVMKIRLHMWVLKMNYKRKDEENMCPLCNKAEDTTAHVLECETEHLNRKYRLHNNTEQEWETITHIFRRNREKRDHIGKQSR